MNILITGASRGLGFELVKQFAKDKNNKVVAIARNEEQLLSLQTICENQFGNHIHIYSINFLAKDLESDLKKVLTKHNTHFDILINNAGYLVNKPFLNTEQQEINEVYQINVFAPILLMQQIIPSLDNDKLCHIINIGSMGGFQGSVKFPGLSVYSSSKAALASLTECLAEEFKEKSIKVNCLALGSVQTEMLNKAFPGYLAQSTSVEMAEYVVQFSINGSKFMNGKIVSVSTSTP